MGADSFAVRVKPVLEGYKTAHGNNGGRHSIKVHVYMGMCFCVSRIQNFNRAWRWWWWILIFS